MTRFLEPLRVSVYRSAHSDSLSLRTLLFILHLLFSVHISIYLSMRINLWPSTFSQRLYIDWLPPRLYTTTTTYKQLRGYIRRYGSIIRVCSSGSSSSSHEKPPSSRHHFHLHSIHLLSAFSSCVQKAPGKARKAAAQRSSRFISPPIFFLLFLESLLIIYDARPSTKSTRLDRFREIPNLQDGGGVVCSDAVIIRRLFVRLILI